MTESDNTRPGPAFRGGTGERVTRERRRNPRSRWISSLVAFRYVAACSLLLLTCLPAPVSAQHSVADLIASFKTRGRAVSDLLLDADGNMHIAWTVTEGTLHEAGTLFYTRLDRGGTVSSESQITKFGGAYDIRLDVDSHDRATVLYWQLNRFYVASFDETGAMKTDLDRILTEEETDARFEFCRDEADNLYILGRGTLDYFWKIDPAGQILAERRGRWLREPTPGFLCQLVNPSTLLIVWRTGTARGDGRAGAVRSLKFDIASFSGSASRAHDLSKVAEAREPGIVLAEPHLTRSGRDVLLLTSAADSAAESFTYRVRFNAKGDPVRRWELRRIYHLEATTPAQGHCTFRTGLLLSRRPGPRGLDLQGIGSDGNIYHMTGKIQALR